MNDKTLSSIFATLGIVFIIIAHTAPIIFLKKNLSLIIKPGLVLATNFEKPGLNWIKALVNIRNLVDENNVRLSKETEIEAIKIKQIELEHENELLRKELNLVTQNKSNLIIANIIGRSVSGSRYDLLIDKGSDDGVAINQAGINSGYLVGKIVEVFPKSSRIATIFNHNLNITVTLQESRALGLMHGDLKGLILDQVPIDQQIKEGETVITSGIANEVPRGIPVGRVDKVISKKADIYQTLQINSPINIQDIELLSIIKNE